jgi:hypothetical protein
MVGACSLPLSTFASKVIRVLGKRMCGDIVEIGQRLVAVKSRVGHGKWLGWLDREFG